MGVGRRVGIKVGRADGIGVGASVKPVSKLIPQTYVSPIAAKIILDEDPPTIFTAASAIEFSTAGSLAAFCGIYGRSILVSTQICT